MEEATPSPDRKMMKLPTFDNLFPNLVPRAHLQIQGKVPWGRGCLFPSLSAKIRSRVTTAITFSRQNDAGSHASIT